MSEIDTSTEAVERLATEHDEQHRPCDGYCINAKTADTLRALAADPQAMVAAAYEAAWLTAQSTHGQKTPEEAEVAAKTAMAIGREIRALIDQPARAALDRVIAEAKAGEREACYQAVDEAGYYCVPPYDETGSLPEQVEHSLAAIRARGGDSYG